MRKAVFFDIDGTLWDDTNYIPESTRAGIKRLQEKGNLAFINSGRAKGFIQFPELVSLGFDGLVCSCGTHIEMDGKILYEYIMSPELARFGLDVSRSFGFRPIFEGPEYLYMDESDFGIGDPYGDKLRREVSERILPIRGNEDTMCANKFSCATEDADTEGCFAALEDKFDFLVHNPYVVEIVPKGHNKGTGIAKVCELLGIDVADTFAVGDSANDLDMLKLAGVGIAMGNGSDIAKAAAGYITAPLREDGIFKALGHFGLI